MHLMSDIWQHCCGPPITLSPTMPTSASLSGNAPWAAWSVLTTFIFFIFSLFYEYLGDLYFEFWQVDYYAGQRK